MSSPLKKEIPVDTDPVTNPATADPPNPTTSPSPSLLPPPPLAATTPPHPIHPPTAREKLSVLSTSSALRDVRSAKSSVTSQLYISAIRTDGFALLVSDCHHVLEWPVALLPSGGKKGDVLDFNLTISPTAKIEAHKTMSTIQDVLKATAVQ